VAQNRPQRAGVHLAAAGGHHRKSATEARQYMPTLSTAAIDFGTEAAKPAQKLTDCHA
jgi:hypothetical protein